VPVKSPVKKNPAKNAPLAILHADLFSNIPWLLHGFSTRTGGFSRVYGGNALNLGSTKEDSRNLVEKNRAAFLQKLGAANQKENWPLVTLRQIHSDLIHCVTTPPGEQLAGDGLITCNPEIVLGIQTADCLPIILVDTKKRAVGVFHAGWRGTIKRIVEKGVGEMRRCFGSMPRDIKAAIGPGIHGCCYEVGEEVRRAFEAQFEYASALFREAKDSDHIRERYPMLFLTSRAPGHSDLPKRIFLDLAEANRRQLLAVGISARNIESSPLCTACRTDLLFSYRKEKGGTGRMLAAVGIKASK
jgi:purine-nucleoside/S-methyl-5'-thioadenosine phosphorylase / adenosine deaminase